MAAFILMSCWRGLQTARAMVRLERLPRRDGFLCPLCHEAPQAGVFWQCSHCGARFDTFETQAKCPQCAAQFAMMKCLNCGGLSPLDAWIMPPPAGR